MSYYGITIAEIDNGYFKIKDFNNDCLFLNIYNFWCFSNYLSMYYIWRITALDRLKMNLKRKWMTDLTNVNLFIELVERKTEKLNPLNFYFDSESYFEKLILLKPGFDKLIKPHRINIIKKRKKNVRKCIRYFFYFSNIII